MARAENNEILILGGVTHKNRGDLAMMDGLFSHLRQISPAAEPVLYSWNPEVSRRAFEVECRRSPDSAISGQFVKRSSWLLALIDMARFILNFILFRLAPRHVAQAFTYPNRLAFFEQLSAARAVVIHGSGSFNSYWWHDWVYPKTACAIAARIAGKPVLLTSQGVGPFEHPLDKIVAATFFRMSAFLGVRDGSKSAAVMRKLGAQPTQIWQTGDDALLLPELSGDETTALLNGKALNPGEMLIGVNVRDASAYSSAFSESGLDKLAAALAAVASRRKARLVFIPISYDKLDDDRKSAETIAGLIGSDIPVTIVHDEKSAAELRALISRMHICIGISYHFLLFGLSADVPSVGLFRNNYYHQKQTGLFDLFGQGEQCIDIRHASLDDITAKIDAVIDERDRLARDLAHANKRLKEEAKSAHAQFARIVNAALANQA